MDRIHTVLSKLYHEAVQQRVETTELHTGMVCQCVLLMCVVNVSFVAMLCCTVLY
jgi:hypothetical protein